MGATGGELASNPVESVKPKLVKKLKTKAGLKQVVKLSESMVVNSKF